jgi:hypothetical protein
MPLSKTGRQASPTTRKAQVVPWRLVPKGLQELMVRAHTAPRWRPVSEDKTPRPRTAAALRRRRQRARPPRLGQCRWSLSQRRWGLVWLSEDHVDSDACSAKHPDLFHELREPAARPRPSTKPRQASLVEVHDHDSARRLKAVRRPEKDIVGPQIQFGQEERWMQIDPATSNEAISPHAPRYP